MPRSLWQGLFGWQARIAYYIYSTCPWTSGKPILRPEQVYICIMIVSKAFADPPSISGDLLHVLLLPHPNPFIHCGLISGPNCMNQSYKFQESCLVFDSETT